MSRAAVTKYLKAENDPQADAAVTEYVGLEAEEQAAFAGEMAAFMRGETDAQPDILNEKEQQHMRDVRTLTGNAGSMSKTYLYIAAALAVAAAWTAAKLEKRRYMPKLIGLLAAVSIVMLLVNSVTGDIGALGFEAMFVEMHEVLFQNDLWLMNPETDILIRMMPQQLFEQALLDCAVIALRLMLISTLMLAALHIVIENMIRRHVVRK
jgi:integral membrane protein (TIGR01906 family)